MRLGIIGYGYWGPNLLRNFAQSPLFQVVALAERRGEARERAARALPGLRCHEDAAELVAAPDLDAVVIATPVATHFPLARAALLAGKHVLVEKPICATAAEAEELVAIAARVGRTLLVDHTFLFTGAVHCIKQSVDAGRLGKVCYFDSMRVNLGLFQTDVNVLWDLAPHDLSIIDHLLDDEVVAVDATGYCHVNPGLPDMVYLTLHYARNSVAHFNLSWMSPMKVRRFAIGGTRQMLIWDDLDQDQKIRIYDSGIEFRPEEHRATIMPDYRVGDIYSPRVPRQEALGGVVRHFAAVIRGEVPALMDGRHGLKVVRVLEQAQRVLDRNLAEVASRRAVAP
ncbi:MAG: gfo/Idh/MocA family oxidoreductase [Rhodospirillales bacterium]|nr:gfo/Idh/MocA family oxidoreductase [Rhodospirillales bacterium]